MFLKKLTINGFKSFCDRVDFDFGPGITCIVGPNGCGKSNFVDAVKWVLGEQSARSLRGRQMVDMLFNGSSARKSSSVAQIDLLFDNANHQLPTDLEEVTITRKLYRSGESEYLINGEPARLKDVRELFLDTGVGVHAYSIIEQGKVDSLLQSSPQDRRIIFEEAAGISRYKARRREAERKLDRTQQNLLRVEDIIQELEKRLRSVKVQAGRARTYKEHEERLNQLRSTFSMAEYHRFTQELDRLGKDLACTTDEATKLNTDIDHNETDSSRLTIRLDKLAKQIAETDNQLVQAQSNLAALEERIESAHRRVDEQTQIRDQANQRLINETQRNQQTSLQLDEAETSAVALGERAEALRIHIESLHAQDHELAQDFADAQRILEDEKAGIIDLVRKSAQTRNELVRLTTQRESLDHQTRRLSQRNAEIEADLQGQRAQEADLLQQLASIEATIDEKNQLLASKKSEASRLGDEQQKLIDELAATKEYRSASQSRLDLLRDLDSKLDGVGAGVRKVLGVIQESDDARNRSTVIGLVADIFETDAAHAQLLEAALDSADQYIVADNRDALLDFIQTIGDLPGRITAICLDHLPPIINEREFVDQPGFVARTNDLVTCDETYRCLARHLLGKTIVVETFEDAKRFAKLDVAGHRFITKLGELIEADGRIVMGSTESSTGLISRKSEIREISAQLVDVDEQIESLSQQLAHTQVQADDLDAAQQALRNTIYACRTEKIETSAAIQTITDTIARHGNEQPLIAQELLLLEKEIQEILEQCDENARLLSTLEKESEIREERVLAHEDHIDHLTEKRRGAQEELTQTRVDIGQLTEKRSAIAEQVNHLKRALRESQTLVTTAKQDIAQCEQRIEDAQTSISEGTDQLDNLRRAIEQGTSQASELRNQREQTKTQLDGITVAVKSARTMLATAEQRSHELEVSLAECNVRRDDLIHHTQEEIGVDLSQLYTNYQHEDQDWEAVEQEIGHLRQKMSRLGHVNLNAIDELDELEQRHGFLKNQHDDLAESQRQLELLIDKLNKESQERFRAAFFKIRDHFRAMFRKLFGGGRADIILEDTDDILECGIEIVAQPPGKDLQAISLMSGGEKSMTAIALLMSIFKTRPAPFTILDEVDAALDEANNERFNRIVQDFATESQFIVITHSKWTMNIGDRLYGITMQEPGVSTRVSVDLDKQRVA